MLSTLTKSIFVHYSNLKHWHENNSKHWAIVMSKKVCKFHSLKISKTWLFKLSKLPAAQFRVTPGSMIVIQYDMLQKTCAITTSRGPWAGRVDLCSEPRSGPLFKNYRYFGETLALNFVKEAHMNNKKSLR